MTVEEYIVSKHGQEAFDKYGDMIWAIEKFSKDAPKEVPTPPTPERKQTLRRIAAGLTVMGDEVNDKELYDVS